MLCSPLTWHCRFNKYSQIAARALRQSLKETERVAAEKRGATILRYQEWKDGQGGQQVCRRSLSRYFLTTEILRLGISTANRFYYLPSSSRIPSICHARRVLWYDEVLDMGACVILMHQVGVC